MSREIFFDEPMSRHTSWRVGGPADQFFLPKSFEDLSCYLNELSSEIPIFWCGLGSNLLVRDGGLRAAVIVTQKYLSKIEHLEENKVRAEVGTSCATLARFCARIGLSGIEFLAGVPGTVGGSLAMNAGCHGGETWMHVDSVELMDRSGHIKILPASQFIYGYRHVQIPKDHGFIAAYFKLSPGEKEKSFQIIRDLLAHRTRTQPTGEPSGGSTFRNPHNDFAGRLIELVGLKGYCVGGAMISPKHANFIVNTGVCLAADIEALIEHVRHQVEKITGVQLILEVQIVGESL